MKKLYNCLKSACKHPFILLIIGAFLSYFIVPILQSKNQTDKIIKEQKIIILEEFVLNNTKTNSELNNLQTNLEIFNKDFIGLNKSYNNELYLKNVNEFRLYYNKAYSEFDKYVWWWYWDLYHKSKVNNLISTNDLERLDTLLVKYKDNIVTCTNLISLNWDNLLRKMIKPNDSTCNALQETRQSLDTLRYSRDKIIGEIISMYNINK